MSTEAVATRKNIDDLQGAIRKDFDNIIDVLDVMMTRIDDRFNKVEGNIEQSQGQMNGVLNRLDHIDRRLEISEDERLVMAHQLTRLHDWVEKAAARIDIKFVH